MYLSLRYTASLFFLLGPDYSLNSALGLGFRSEASSTTVGYVLPTERSKGCSSLHSGRKSDVNASNP